MSYVLVGSGGFAEEMKFWIETSSKPEKIKGYVGLENPRLDLPYLGTFESAIFDGALAIMAIGHRDYRKATARCMAERGFKFSGYTHPTALVAPTAKLGEGVIIGPFCIVSAGAELGDHVLLNNYASIGHHSKVGQFSICGPYSAVTGGCELGAECELGTHAALFPKIKLGRSTRVGIGSALLHSTTSEDRTFVGVPARNFVK
jgi:sugar O-acyltransferase (sialic acid O-acetyltransferase NeuD family)